MVKELNAMTENRQELKLKVVELSRDIKDQINKIDMIEGEK
jgi:hypothetical protein